MKDPNLNKIIKTNIENIKNNNLGTTISHASSYLDNIYGYKNENDKKLELENFIQEVKYLANKLRIRNNSNGVKNE